MTVIAQERRPGLPVWAALWRKDLRQHGATLGAAVLLTPLMIVLFVLWDEPAKASLAMPGFVAGACLLVGAALFAQENADGTAEFVGLLPCARWKVAVAKAGLGLLASALVVGAALLTAAAFPRVWRGATSPLALGATVMEGQPTPIQLTFCVFAVCCASGLFASALSRDAIRALMLGGAVAGAAGGAGIAATAFASWVAPTIWPLPVLIPAALTAALLLAAVRAHGRGLAQRGALRRVVILAVWMGGAIFTFCLVPAAWYLVWFNTWYGPSDAKLVGWASADANGSLAVDTTSPHRADVWLFNASGGAAKRMSSATLSLVRPRLSPSGEWLLTAIVQGIPLTRYCLEPINDSLPTHILRHMPTGREFHLDLGRSISWQADKTLGTHMAGFEDSDLWNWLDGRHAVIFRRNGNLAAVSVVRCSENGVEPVGAALPVGPACPLTPRERQTKGRFFWLSADKCCAPPSIHSIDASGQVRHYATVPDAKPKWDVAFISPNGSHAMLERLAGDGKHGVVERALFDVQAGRIGWIARTRCKGASALAFDSLYALVWSGEAWESSSGPMSPGLFVVRMADMSVRKIPDEFRHMAGHWIIFSPDGRNAVCLDLRSVNKRPPEFEHVLVNLDRAEAISRTAIPNYVHFVAWPQPGTLIGYPFEHLDPMRVCAMSPDGSHRRVLFPPQ